MSNLYSYFAGSSIFYPDMEKQNREYTISLLKHTMKIINIYYHIFTNQRPLIMAKSQKVELFGNAKELAITQNFGYFGSESIYLKLYQTLKSAYDNYKVSTLTSFQTTITTCKTVRHPPSNAAVPYSPVVWMVFFVARQIYCEFNLFCFVFKIGFV